MPVCDTYAVVNIGSNIEGIGEAETGGEDTGHRLFLSAPLCQSNTNTNTNSAGTRRALTLFRERRRTRTTRRHHCKGF